MIRIIIAALIVFGSGGFYVGRGRRTRHAAPPSPTVAVKQPVEDAPVIAEAPVMPEPAIAAAPQIEVAVEVAHEPEPEAAVAPMSRMRSAFAAVVGKVRGSAGISNDTWDDLEEALLRADVGVKISDELSLRTLGPSRQLLGGRGTERVPSTEKNRVTECFLLRRYLPDRSGLTNTVHTDEQPNIRRVCLAREHLQ